MKKTILFSLLLIIAINSFSQQNDPAPTLTKQDYLAKSKKQKTATWILSIGGFVMTCTGAGLLIDDASAETSDALVTLFTLGTVQQITPDKDNTAIGSVLFFTGLGSMLGSIPFSIASKKNKKKAMSLSFNNQKIPSLQKSSFVYQTIPSLKLKISL